MKEQGRFYVRGIDGNNEHSIATGIQVIIPEGMSFHEAKTYAIGRIAEQLANYFVGECLVGIGMKP